MNLPKKSVFEDTIQQERQSFTHPSTKLKKYIFVITMTCQQQQINSVDQN